MTFFIFYTKISTKIIIIIKKKFKKKCNFLINNSKMKKTLPSTWTKKPLGKCRIIDTFSQKKRSTSDEDRFLKPNPDPDPEPLAFSLFPIKDKKHPQD